MSEIKEIIDELNRIHDGEAWHGPSLREILTGVSAEQAAAKPVAAAHSIWELALHVAAWERVFTRRLAGQPAEEPEEGDFPPVAEVSAAAWQQTLGHLDDTHRQLLETVSSLTDERLEDTVPGRDYSVRFQLHSLVRHQVYHAGQMALLKKA
jgi:uncharacterized damage-inducible protein DinB